jgi:triosephosphate isomerase
VRRKIIAGNAKMNLDREGITSLLETLTRDLQRTPSAHEILYCPPFTLLGIAAGILQGSPIRLGAQNMAAPPAGAYTGEISGGMLVEAGCTHVILGHSERRTLFGETDAQVRAKAASALEQGLIPVVCVGETETERMGGATEIVLSRQAAGSLEGLAVGGPEGLVVAYEPVWAIGTGRTASPDEAQAAHRHLRGEIAKVLGPEIARGVRILYGGSVKPDNAAELLGQPDIDGSLVGGASLRADSFLGILRAGAGR